MEPHDIVFLEKTRETEFLLIYGVMWKRGEVV